MKRDKDTGKFQCTCHHVHLNLEIALALLRSTFPPRPTPFQPLDPIALEAAALLAPAIVRNHRYADRLRRRVWALLRTQLSDMIAINFPRHIGIDYSGVQMPLVEVHCLVKTFLAEALAPVYFGKTDTAE